MAGIFGEGLGTLGKGQELLGNVAVIVDGCIYLYLRPWDSRPLDSIAPLNVVKEAGLRMSRILHSFVVAIYAPCSGLAH